MVKQQQRAQYGNFFSVPMAYQAANKDLKHAIKFEFRTAITEDNKNPLGVEEVVSTDVFLVDIGVVNLENIIPDQIAKDCDIVKKIAMEYPGELRDLIQALQLCDIRKGEQITKKIGFTEESFVRAHGGAIGLLIIVLAALALSGCAHSTGAGKKPAKAGYPPAK